MNEAAQRILSWLTVLLVCSPAILMIWFPDIFTAGLHFGLRHSLEFAFPLFTHLYALHLTYVRNRGRTRWTLTILFSMTSLAAFAYLFHNYTVRAFLSVTAFPSIYIFYLAMNLVLAQRRRKHDNTSQET